MGKKKGHSSFSVKQPRPLAPEPESDSDSEVTPSLKEEELTRLKLKYQKRALCRKNLTLQGRQKLTNVCQILTPITGLFVVQSLKNLGENSMRAVLDKTLYIPVPFLFNVPYMPL